MDKDLVIGGEQKDCGCHQEAYVSGGLHPLPCAFDREITVKYFASMRAARLL
jgi:hypothetical protein